MQSLHIARMQKSMREMQHAAAEPEAAILLLQEISGVSSKAVIAGNLPCPYPLNRSVMLLMKSVQEQIQQEKKQEHNGNNGKASMMQIRYLKDLCKNLDIKPAVDIAGLSSEKASRYISDLEKMRKLAVKV